MAHTDSMMLRSRDSECIVRSIVTVSSTGKNQAFPNHHSKRHTRVEKKAAYKCLSVSQQHQRNTPFCRLFFLQTYLLKGHSITEMTGQVAHLSDVSRYSHDVLPIVTLCSKLLLDIVQYVVIDLQYRRFVL
jgi:hypothetical protein